ncbi:MAG: hypothetical protein SF187_15605 [Deltaproteobacteria bacterium]|nr:hypothetical protein [Deltaproteobacteria bacterium]
MQFPSSVCVAGGLWLVGATALAAPAPRPHTAAPVTRTMGRQPRFSQAQISPCGRHTLHVGAGAVFVDGQRVHRPDERVKVLATPVWRHDGKAVAWVERTRTGARLAVLADVTKNESVMFWALPAAVDDDQLAWAGPHRVVVGNNILSPRAVASWTED